MLQIYWVYIESQLALQRNYYTQLFSCGKIKHLNGLSYCFHRVSKREMGNCWIFIVPIKVAEKTLSRINFVALT